MQDTFDLGEPRQNDLTFPTTLAEKYQPSIYRFVGLKEPKRIMLGLLKNPKPCSLLFVGEPGCGKTSMAMKFAEQLPAAHHHIRAQSADVETLDRIWERCQYYPAKGRFHVVHIDEVDGATDKAQLQLLSRMDGTARLKPMFGGGFERGDVPPIIYIFTCNGRTVDGVMKPPAELLPRFLSRCITLYFEPVEAKVLAKYLAAIWKKEGGKGELPMAYLEHLATGTGVRDALMRLDSELIAPHSPEEIRETLKAESQRREALERQRGDKLHILTATLLKPGGLPENSVCGHRDQPHYARGLCLPCYRLFRAGQRKLRKAGTHAV
jgi:replication-associated recombination protein RarA